MAGKYSYTLQKMSLQPSTVSVDTIRANQTITDGNTIVSAGRKFELGFFSPGSSTNRYLGIWYMMSKSTLVWVANRETPLNNTSGVVMFNSKGSMVVTSSDGKILWISVSRKSAIESPVVQLLDDGNLVLRDAVDRDSENYLWQSFDYPVDTQLPGMKFGVDLVNGIDRCLTPWRSVDDPAPGNFTHKMDTNGFPQLLLWKGPVLWARAGPWVGLWFSGNSKTKMFGFYVDEFVFNEKEIYFRYELADDNTPISRYVLNPDGESTIMIWSHRNQDWVVYTTLHMDKCDLYGFCGAYGGCNPNNYPRCECLKGFVPKYSEKWKAGAYSDGCVCRSPMSCGGRESFVKFSGVKLPDTRISWYDLSMNLYECESLCLKNCSCTAYTNADIREGGSGCILWFGELMDIKYYTDGEDIYVKMSSDFDFGMESKSSRVTKAIVIVLAILATALLFLLLHLLRMRIQKKRGRIKFNSEMVALNKIEGEDFKVPLFDFTEIANATNNFSDLNKLGEGGFGPVYKGLLTDGQAIAVKRLAKDSRQGVDEFMNEVSCIAKLQHRNLVSLLGCCVDKGERMLIYEYLPNRCLDSCIFDEEASRSMDWPKRYNIINGIARGLLYLHQDSKLRIIHRDLKTSNVLLDQEMNPKISDFGMARSFGGNQTQANTTRVVGTYGYMPPEYAIDGIFSTKSDVYSFGVLVIEIVSGKKNRSFIHSDHSLNLLGHAWRSYKEDKLLGLLDEAILESCNHVEVFRVIQIGLLCVQQHPVDRPCMSHVVLMLSSNIALPHPKQPGFFMERTFHDPDSSSNQLTITVLEPR
ncbi:hypothetical protein AgCh_003892 [Apium graveolens]